MTGPAILLLMVGMLYFYDSCFARPAREKVERLEQVMVEIRSTLSRIDERTLLLIQANGINCPSKIKTVE